MFSSDQAHMKSTKWDICINQLKLKDVYRKSTNKLSCSNEIQIVCQLQKLKDFKCLIHSYLNELASNLKKSSQLSEEIRSEGNKIYKRSDDPNANFFESCFLYTLALKCSENNSDLAYAHGNRAAALMKIGFHKVARDDCEEAIKLQHPDLFKIYERLCSLSHGSIAEMRRNVANLENHLKKGSKQSKEIVMKYKTRLKSMEKETHVENDEQLDLSKLVLEREKSHLKLTQQFCTTTGRYVIANQPIARNEELLTETPFAFVPIHNYGIKKYFNADCENCGLTNIWPFLCLECRYSAYCSRLCRDNHATIHRYECAGYQKNLFSEIGIAHLSLRVLIVGFPALVTKLEYLDKGEYQNMPEKIFEKILQISYAECTNYFDYTGDDANIGFRDYAKVLCLQPNLFNRGLFPARNSPYAYTSLMLSIYLREYTTFFQDHLTKAVYDLLNCDDWDLLIGALLLRHIGQLISNGHAIIDFRQNIFTTDALKLMLQKNQPNGGGLHMLLSSQRVFTGIFPRISMFNHSCNPNIRNSFNGNKLTVYASTNISQNDEIYNCYGPHYLLMSYQERQDTLRLQYNFICKCQKCLESNDEYRFNNSVLCRHCGKRLFYPDKRITDDDDPEEDESDEVFRLFCDDCQRVHENIAMKKFFSFLAQSSDVTTSSVSMNQLYASYLEAVAGMGSLDEIRWHMTEMMLHSLITNRDAINLQNVNIPLTLCIDLLNVKESLFGQYSIEFVESGFFLLDIVSILIDKGIMTERNTNQLVGEMMDKFVQAKDICSSNIKAIINNYIMRYCYTYSP